MLAHSPNKACLEGFLSSSGSIPCMAVGVAMAVAVAIAVAIAVGVAIAMAIAMVSPWGPAS